MSVIKTPEALLFVLLGEHAIFWMHLCAYAHFNIQFMRVKHLENKFMKKGPK